MKPNISHPHTRIENVHWSDQLGVESHVNQTWSPKLCKTTRWIPKILKNCHLWPPAMQKPQQHPGVVHGSYAGPISHDITQHWSTPRAGRPTPGVRPAPTMRQVSWGSTGAPCRALWLFPTNPSRKLMMKNMTDDQTSGWRNMSDKILYASKSIKRPSDIPCCPLNISKLIRFRPLWQVPHRPPRPLAATFQEGESAELSRRCPLAKLTIF